MGKSLCRKTMALCLTVLLVFSATIPAFADGNQRVFGPNRYATCIQVAEALKAELGVGKFESVVVARGDQYADALSGDYLAIREKAPIILVSKGNNTDALNYIKNNLAPEGKIYILGGEMAVDAGIEGRLKAITPNVTRLHGKNRYDTNLAILSETLMKATEIVIEHPTIIPSVPTENEVDAQPAEDEEEGQPTEDEVEAQQTKESNAASESADEKDAEETAKKEEQALEEEANESKQESTGEETSNPPLVYTEYEYVDEDLLICSGKGFADALSASAVGKPIMLVGDSLTGAQIAFLNQYASHIKSIYIIGGPVAVNETVAKQLSNYRIPKRISGKNRYSTATAIAKAFYPKATEVVMASGTNFPDGLCGGVLAAEKKAPLLLTCMDLGFSSAYQYVFGRQAIRNVTILGGTAVVADDATGLTSEGEKKSGLLQIGKKYFYTNSQGNFEKDKEIKVGDATFVFGSDYLAKTESIVNENGVFYYYKNGSKDKSACKSFKDNGSTWNVINGIATKVVTEKDRTLNRALVLVGKITSDKMTKGEKLRKCFDYLQKNYKEYNPRIPHSKAMDWYIVYANDIFVSGGGNCFSFGAAFAFMARALGYDNVYACNSGGHGWAEIEGLVYDPEWGMHHKDLSYFGIQYGLSTGPTYKQALAPGYAWMRIKI